MKKLVVSLLVLTLILSAFSMTVFAAAGIEGTWATPYFITCMKVGAMRTNEVQAYSNDFTNASVSHSEFTEALRQTAANSKYTFITNNKSSITRYEAIEIISSYLTSTYAADPTLQGRQKYMTIAEMYKVANHQKIDINYVYDFTVVYTCGIFNSGSCDGTRTLTQGELAAICVRLMEYEKMQTENNIDALDMFYNQRCTCILSGEHD